MARNIIVFVPGRLDADTAPSQSLEQGVAGSFAMKFYKGRSHAAGPHFVATDSNGLETDQGRLLLDADGKLKFERLEHRDE